MVKKYTEKNRLIQEFRKSVRNYFINKVYDYKCKYSVINEFLRRKTVQPGIKSHGRVLALLGIIALLGYSRICVMKRQNRRDAFMIVEQKLPNDSNRI